MTRLKNLSRLTRAALTLLVMLLTATTAWADAPSHKIVVIADPHVMSGDLYDEENSAWQAYLASSRKLLDKSQVLFDQTVTNLIEGDVKPELVLIVGDLTKDGEEVNHDYVKGKLDELKTAGIQPLVIPGNHDLGTSDANTYYGDAADPTTTIGTADAFATLYADYGYGASSERLENTLTYACEPITDLVVIGIDSGTDGTLSSTTLNWVCAKALAARAAGKQVIAMMHHPLIPHITGGETFVSNVSVSDYANVRNRLADAGITAIFTGHFHTSDIAKDWNADKSKTIYDITTGSLCSYPCDYRIVTLNSAMTKMSIVTETATDDEIITETITAADAKTRLTTVVTNLAKAKIQAKLENEGTNAFLAAAAANMMGPKLANAYVFHAEGNENSDPDAQTLLEELNETFASYPAYQALVNSMLQDKSNYGTDREDQTNDRTLTVSMPMTWEGSGTEEDPYLIKSTIQLNLLAERVNSGTDYEGNYFKLANDITYSYAGLEATQSNYTAIGCLDDDDYYFRGTFDGNNKTISGIRIYKAGTATTDCGQGVFGQLGEVGVVKNLTLADSRVTGFADIGGIVGYCLGTIENCTALASVTVSPNGVYEEDESEDYGGIAGYNKGSISNCTSSAIIAIGDDAEYCAYIGGIVGFNGGDISNCNSSGTITIGDSANGCLCIGGIAGISFSYTSISNCTSTTTITIGDNANGCKDIGGIVGFCIGKISNCISSTTIAIGNNPKECCNYGGIAGYNRYSSLTCNLAKNVTISGQNYLGAILGYNEEGPGTLKNNYYSGCTVGGATSSIGCNGADITANDGAVPAKILNDDGPSLPPLNEGETVAFRREFMGGAAATVCMPFDYTPGTEGEYFGFSGVAYNGTIQRWEATMTSVAASLLAANTPYLFMPEGTGTSPVLFHGAAAASVSAGTTNVGAWDFKGTFERITWTETTAGNAYGLAATGGLATDGVTHVDPGQFVKFASGALVKPMRAFILQKEKPSSARGSEADESLPQSITVVLIDAEGGATEIGTIDTRTGEITLDVWYDLNGHRLNGKPTQKGVYIRNGVKVVIK